MSSAHHLDSAAPTPGAEAATPASAVGRTPSADEPEFSPPERASMDAWAAPDGGSARPAQVLLEQDPWFFQLPGLFREEAARFQQEGSASMSVALRMTEQAEVLAHFTRQAGGVAVQVWCQAEDLARLSGFWPSLVQVLAPRLRVGALRSSPGAVAGDRHVDDSCPTRPRRQARRAALKKSA